MNSTAEFVLNVVLIAISIVLVLGGVTAGVFMLGVRIFGRGRPELDDAFWRRQRWLCGAILLGVGTLELLGSIPSYFGRLGPLPAGTCALSLAGVFMIAWGRVLMICSRPLRG